MTKTPDISPLRRRVRFVARLLFAFTLSSVPMLSESQRAAFIALVRDPLAILDGRSPGARGNGPLIQTKGVATESLPSGDHLLSAAHVLPPGTLSGPAPSMLADAGHGGMPAVDLPRDGGSGAGPGAPGLLGQSLSQASARAISAGSSAAGGALPGGGASPGGGSADHEVLPAGETAGHAVNAVPEPASWAMLLAGFFLLGGLLRRTGRAHSARAPIR